MTLKSTFQGSYPPVPLSVAYGEAGKQRAEVVGRHPHVLGSKEAQEEMDKLCLRESSSLLLGKKGVVRD